MHFRLVVKCLSPPAAKIITKALTIPTIGIGSSIYCDVVYVVTDDILKIRWFYPKFPKNMRKILNRIIEKAGKKIY